MKREELSMIIQSNQRVDDSTRSWCEYLVNNIYNNFEQQLKEKDKEITRLRKRLEQFEHTPCRYEWGGCDD